MKYNKIKCLILLYCTFVNVVHVDSSATAEFRELETAFETFDTCGQCEKDRAIKVSHYSICLFLNVYIFFP